MIARNIFGLMLSVMLLLLAAGSGLAYGPQPTVSSEAVGVNADLAANFPWVNIEVDTPGSVGQYTSVAIDPLNDTTYVSYYDATNMELRLARNRGFSSYGNCGPNNSWFCQTVDSVSDVGMYSSIAINPANDEIGIAYYDATNGRLKYVHGETCLLTCAWSIEVIDQPLSFPTDNTGRFSSLAYNSSGQPYIAYYFENTVGVDALMVATGDVSGGDCGYGSVAGKWQCDTIKLGEGVGQYASLAVGGSGNRYIAYYDGANGDLWHATSRSGTNCGPGDNTWLCYPVSVANDVGKYTSLYVDNSNDFHIAYYDATTDELKYAVDVGSGGNCGLGGSARCDTIDSMPADTHPVGVSMAEDKAYYPIIAYQAADGSLNVARPVAALGLSVGGGNCGPVSTWYCETIDPDNPWVPYRNGDFVSIAINPNGLATTAYFGFITLTQGNLNVSYQRFHQVYLPLDMKNH